MKLLSVETSAMDLMIETGYGVSRAMINAHGSHLRVLWPIPKVDVRHHHRIFLSACCALHQRGMSHEDSTALPFAFYAKQDPSNV